MLNNTTNDQNARQAREALAFFLALLGSLALVLAGVPFSLVSALWAGAAALPFNGKGTWLGALLAFLAGGFIPLPWLARLAAQGIERLVKMR
ncbi:MAG: hypothetical protein K2W96_28435 [Gemmataceae bacterium]|nr:hypothetical protein [Gemmataceae bacterium]